MKGYLNLRGGTKRHFAKEGPKFREYLKFWTP